MFDEDIEKVNAWFDEHDDCYGTYRIDKQYTVCENDLESFRVFLAKEFPDVILKCYFGSDNTSIWFFEDDLRDAVFP